MSEDIISQDEGKPFIVTFFVGKDGPSIQFTNPHSLTKEGYVQMSYNEAVDFLKETLKKLEKFKKENEL